MGKKVSPHSFRLGISRQCDSIWYDKRQYKQKFLQDIAIREFLMKKLAGASVSRVTIERSAGKVSVFIHSAKPGIIVGRGGENITKLQNELSAKFDENFAVTINEIHKPELEAMLVAQNLARQIERRFPYRRVAKTAIERAKEVGNKGIKIIVAGRLNGVDIARRETFSYGKIPLHTLRAKIDYATAEANTTYGVIGIKVWIYHGLVFKNQNIQEQG